MKPMNNLKVFLTAFIIIYIIPYVAQQVKLKDGIILGERNDFISDCTKGANKKLMNINGLEFETYKYCACVCDNLLPTLNSWEIEKAAKENKMMDLFLKDENFEILKNCIEGNFEIADDYEYGNSDNPELQKKIGIKL